MTSLRGRSHSWLVTLAIVGASIAFLGIVFLPGKRAIAELRSELKTSQEFVAAAGRLAAATKATQEELDQTQRYNEIWGAAPADSAGVAARFGAIAQVIQQSGAVSTRFAPQPETKYDLVRKIPLSVTCEGAFEQLHKLLVGLETSCRQTWVTNVEFGALGEDGSIVKCELDLVIFAEIGDSSD